MDEQLVKEYQAIKDDIAKVEAEKIKATTELGIKQKELTEIISQLNEMGITDLTKVDEIVEEKRSAFENQLKTLKEKLDNVQGA